MNDEKTVVVNMVSERIITSSEGLALFKALCDLEYMGSYESDVEAESSRYLPPWEAEGDELHTLLSQNKCARAIAIADQQITSAMQEDRLEDIPKTLSALDILQLSRFRPAGSGSGGLVMGRIRLKRDEDVLHTRGWGILMSFGIETDAELPPTWGEPLLMQIFMVLRHLRLKWKAGQVVDEEMEQIRVVSTLECSDDLITTEAGTFDKCLKLKTVISALGGAEFKGHHDVTDNLRRLGIQYLWLAPGVGLVRFLYEHPNNTLTEIELVDFRIQNSEPLYFPLSSGNHWRYRRCDEVTIHNELIRAMPIPGEEYGMFNLTCANHIARAN